MSPPERSRPRAVRRGVLTGHGGFAPAVAKGDRSDRRPGWPAPSEPEPEPSGAAIAGPKFGYCLPADLAAGIVRAQLADVLAVATALVREERLVVADAGPEP